MNGDMFPALRSALAAADSARIGELTDRLLTSLATERLTPTCLRHPLNFLYVPLDRRPDSALRLHLWPGGATWHSLATSRYHLHAWHLTSYVHCGWIVNTMIEAHTSPDTPTHRVFDVVGDSTTDILTPTDELVSPVVVSTETIRGGGVYRIEAGRYHASEAAHDGWSVTVALVTRVPGARERALGPISLTSHRTRREPGRPAELANAARQILAQDG